MKAVNFEPLSVAFLEGCFVEACVFVVGALCEGQIWRRFRGDYFVFGAWADAHYPVEE